MKHFKFGHIPVHKTFGAPHDIFSIPQKFRNDDRSMFRIILLAYTLHTTLTLSPYPNLNPIHNPYPNLNPKTVRCAGYFEVMPYVQQGSHH